jgi:rhodanese-related sulfurtransferase
VTAPAPTVDVHELRDLFESRSATRVLNVRPPAEFEAAHIAGSYNAPLDVLSEHGDEIATRLNEHVILVCRSGGRAAQAEQALQAEGMSMVRILAGGISAWQAAGFEVKRGEPRWNLERFRLATGSPVLAGVLGSVAVPKLKWLAAAIGGGLSAAALTDTCAMGAALSRLPYNRKGERDAQSIVRQLTSMSHALTNPAEPL